MFVKSDHTDIDSSCAVLNMHLEFILYVNVRVYGRGV